MSVGGFFWGEGRGVVSGLGLGSGLGSGLGLGSGSSFAQNP